MSTLYIVPTPIGNLEDITLRALRILKQVSLIAAEDTRTSRVLLDHYDIRTPMISYHEHNKLTRLETVFDALTQGDVALISDAGMPGISDPGYELIQEALKNQIQVVPLPGASALTTALVASGLPTDSFTFLGFPPRKFQTLRDFLQEWKTARQTLIFYESPHRLLNTLQAIQDVMPDRQVVVARELTKIYEEFQRDTPENLLTYFTENPLKGEITLLIAGASENAKALWTEEQVRETMQTLMEQGKKRGEAAKLIAEQSGWERRDIYNLK